jgi:hypothetical protein
MPKRVIDFDAMWGSDKLASCAEWAQAEYAWLYGLADASGCFEMTNLRVIWGRVAAIRRNLTIERLEQVFNEFRDKGLVFVWEHEGKRYGHWTGSDVPGRLPPPSWRMRLERLAPPVPKQQLAEYVSRYSRGRAALPGGGFSVEGRQESSPEFRQEPRKESLKPFANVTPGQSSLERDQDQSFKGGLESDQAQDLNWNKNLNREVKKGFERDTSSRLADREVVSQEQTELYQPVFSNINSQNGNSESRTNAPQARSVRASAAGSAPASPAFAPREKSVLVARELIVGQGPSCGPVRVKPEVLARIRARDGVRDG